MPKTAAAPERETAPKPSHRLWMVSDQPNGRPSIWTEITALWETKSGEGVTGAVKIWLTIPPGTRLVALPATSRNSH